MSLAQLRHPIRLLMCQRWPSARTITVVSHPQLDQVHVTSSKLLPPLSSVSIIPIRGMAKSKDRGKDKKGKGGKGKLTLADDEMLDVIDVAEMREKMFAIVGKLKEDYIKNLSLQTGRGIEDLVIEFENDNFPLKELATISRKGSNLIVLNLTALPDAIKPVINTINESGMNLNPQQEGTMIYLTLPRITRDHRETLARNAKTMFQKSKESIAKVCNNYQKEARDKLQYEKLSKDLVFEVCENLKVISEQMVAECESLMNMKVNELLQIESDDDK